MAYLNISNVDVVFPSANGAFIALREVNLDIEKGEFISIIGHSGCGKSTVLNVVAGLLQATRGGVLLENREVNSPGPDRAVVFQNHSLLPWLTVYENVRIAVDKVFGKSKSKAERHDWTVHNLKLVHMDHALDKLPGAISGGMKQRVGIARALAMQPKVLLMDEPFGALDEITRHKLDADLLDLWRKKKLTVIFVTHSIHEAVFLSSRVVMMAARPGRVVEEFRIDAPYPRTADFMVSPEFSRYAKLLQDSLLRASVDTEETVA